VTTFHAGETVTVKLQETIYHPGYFRISIAETRAADATSKEFPDPALTDSENCHFDRAAVKTAPHDAVLADGLFMVSAQSSENRSLTQTITLPNKPCDKCTLQVVQVMEGHPASSCFYFHCAEIEILPAQGGEAAGSGGGAAMLPASSDDGGGCSVVQVAATNSRVAGWGVLGITWVFGRRRRNVRFRR
jgi:hypothetical protein